jgi:hypothetical protein
LSASRSSCRPAILSALPALTDCLCGDRDLIGRLISTRRRTASDRDGLSGCVSAHRTIDARKAGGARKPMIGSLPVALVGFFMSWITYVRETDVSTDHAMTSCRSEPTFGCFRDLCWNLTLFKVAWCVRPAERLYLANERYSHQEVARAEAGGSLGRDGRLPGEGSGDPGKHAAASCGAARPRGRKSP